MTPARWQQIKQLFDAALSRTPQERMRFLDEACAKDEALRREVETLLASHAHAASFMETPAVAQMANVIVGDAQQLTQGERVGHYEIVAALGAGGMGEVYLAEDVNLQRRVAIKFLPACAAADAQANKRLVREARAVATLDHPHICAIHEIGEAGGRAFIVMQFVEGETLAERIKREKLSVSETLDIAAQIADALAEAHRAHVIHRDIKPSNIMLNARGQVKVLDFGLAKFVEKQIADSAAQTASLLSKPGALLGTMPYMSPEQTRSEVLDERTDVFSFGVVLYEMLSGRQPFMHESGAEIISAILTHEPASLSVYVPHSPPALQQIVEKCLAKDKARRYQTMREAADDLRALQRRKTNSHAAIVSAPTGIIERQTNAPRKLRRWHPAMLAAVSLLLLAAISFGVYRWLRVQPTEAIDSIAVLPLVNNSGDQNLEYLSDGITESIIGNLSQLPKLKVMSRNSVFRFKGKNMDAQDVGKKLNVRAVLTGSIRQVGDQYSIYVEVFNTDDGTAIWQKNYTLKASDIITTQNEIARDTIANLRVKLNDAEQKQIATRPTENAEAYQLYLKGQYEWNKLTQQDLQKAIEYYNQALEIDPNYALAYTGLANSYGILGNSYLPPNEALPKAKAYAAKALAIDDTLAEAHSSMGAVRLGYDWNWAEAEKELKRALALNPNYTDAHVLYSAYLDAMGRFNEARAEAKRGQELDPLSPIINMGFGVTFYHARQYDEAIAQLEKTINLEPHFNPAYLWLGQAYEQKKMYAQASETFQKGISRSERHPMLIAALGHAYALSGERDKANKALDELREMSKQRYVSPYLFAVVYVGLGDKEQAFAWLDKAFQDRAFFLIWLKVEPLFDPLREEPRFQDLLRRVGLP